MNLTAPLTPLPQALHERREGAHRRRRIGGHEIDSDYLQHFNELLESLNLGFGPLEPDQLASAARELTDARELAGSSRRARWPRCILQRMRRAAAIDRMLADPEWSAEESADAAARVVAYLHDDRHLIPNSVPVVGRLDDVIVVEASWPLIAQEVRDYLDFRRLRRIEAALRGERQPYFGFDREAWRAARDAEARWIDHCHRVGLNRYDAGQQEPRFRVQ